MRIGELLITAKKLARSDRAALQPTASQIARYFPDVEVTNEADG